MIGIGELLTLRDLIVDDLELGEGPSDATIVRLLQEARDLVGRIPSATQEAAAMFYVFSRGEFVKEFAVLAVGSYLSRFDIEMSDEDADYLDILADEVEHGLPWEDVLSWFESTIDKRRRR